MIAMLLAGCGHGQRGTRASATTGPATPTTRAAQLRALIEGVKSKTFKIDYGVSLSTPGDAPEIDGSTEPGETPVATPSAADGSGDMTLTGTLTFLQDGADWRSDAHLVAQWAPAAGTAVLTTIVRRGSATVCVNELGSTLFLFTIPPNECIAEPVDATSAGNDPLADPLGGIGDAQLAVSRVEQRTIAGSVATCYEASATLADDASSHSELEICFSSDGLPIAVKSHDTTSDGVSDSQMTATTIARDVTDADFAPPYPPAKTFNLNVQNDTEGKITVIGSAIGSDLNDGEVDIAAGKSGTLNTGLRGDPKSIEITSYDNGWYFTCDWGDAKTHEPIVVTVTMSTFADGSPRPVPHANCAIKDVSPSAPAPTPVVRAPSAGGTPRVGGAIGSFLPRTPLAH